MVDVAESPKIGSMLAATQQKRADAAHKIAAIFAEFPDLERELRELFTRDEKSREPISNGHKRVSAEFVRENAHQSLDEDHGEAPKTNAEKLASFFVGTGNRKMATPDIAIAADMDSITVSNTLWSPKGKMMFEKSNHATNKKVKMWCLRHDEFIKRREGGNGKG